MYCNLFWARLVHLDGHCIKTQYVRAAGASPQRSLVEISIAGRHIFQEFPFGSMECAPKKAGGTITSPPWVTIQDGGNPLGLTRRSKWVSMKNWPLWHTGTNKRTKLVYREYIHDHIFVIKGFIIVSGFNSWTHEINTSDGYS